ncbi:hypothetical protein FA13DRAFT_1715469 [Coprinellus micaceus]|uniref:F-box domain-containing protein n=1 Tax=Coprinellus micaceus TaxID=71717 RepID=A0A4Y7SMY3_COPMI|nr:hypothetical protein FA13DRAFT_1715469 [Coprinellus micaceus]
MWNSGVEHGQMGVVEQQAHVPYLGLVAGAWSSGAGYGSAEHGMGNGTALHRALGMEEFNGFVKALEALVLNSFNVSWNTISLPSTLTKLRLRDAVTCPLPSEIFESLQNLHLIEDLLLDDYLPDGGFPSGLLLPSLKRLETRDSWTRTSWFLGVIRIPNAKHIEVTIEDFVHQDCTIDSYVKMLKDTVQDILKSLPALSRFSMLNFDDQDNATGDPPCFEMGWGRAPISAIECNDKDGLEVALWLERIQTLSLPNTLASINSHFNLNTVSALVLDTSGQLGQDTFVDILARLLHVQKLSLVLCRVSTILVKMRLDPALRHVAKQGDEADIATPYFPALHTLVLDNIDFEEGEGVDELIREAPMAKRKFGLPHLPQRKGFTLVNTHPGSNQVKMLDIWMCINIGTDAFTKLQIALPKIDVQWDKDEDWSHYSTERGDSDDPDGSDEEVKPASDSPEGSV